MKKIFLLLSVITLVSCNQEKQQKEKTESKPISKEKLYEHLQFEVCDVKIYEYRMKDGCQYIGSINSGDGRNHFLTHKGLCDNPIHKK